MEAHADSSTGTSLILESILMLMQPSNLKFLLVLEELST